MFDPLDFIAHLAAHIWQILNHLGLLEEEPVGSSERAPPEITYEPFFDDLPAGEVDEDWLEAVMNVGAN